MAPGGRVGKKLRKRIAQRCPVNRSRGRFATTFGGQYLRISPSGVIFVIAPGYVIITVFPCPD